MNQFKPLLLLAIASITVGCVWVDRDSASNTEAQKKAIMDGFYLYDSINFDSREICFFETFVGHNMDSTEWSENWDVADLSIRHQFFHYVGFGFAILEGNDETRYYGFSDIYKIDHPVKLDTTITYRNLALANLMNDAFDDKQAVDLSRTLPHFLYRLYFQKRNDFSAPMFVGTSFSRSQLLLVLESMKSKYLNYTEEAISRHDKASIVGFELRHSGYLIFIIEKHNDGFRVDELFVPHNDRPRQYESDGISDEYLDACKKA